MRGSSVGGRYGFINMKGDMVIEPVHEIASNFSEGLALVVVGGKRGYMKP
ncbi:MAG: WG repeat-containing protein [Thermodesulfobacteriota bacterium]